jgi:protein-tyrosine phosphatase
MSEIFWIEIEPRVPLAVVLCPRGDRLLQDEIVQFKQGGIQTLVSLLEEDEAEWLGLAEEGPLAARLGLNFLSHPIPDTQVPQNAAEFQIFVRDLASRLRAGERIGVHCRGSIGRATVTTACTLVHLGWSPGDALAAIEAARGCPVPDTMQQRRRILNYEAIP